jgi:hypothetical protein
LVYLTSKRMGKHMGMGMGMGKRKIRSKWFNLSIDPSG